MLQRRSVAIALAAVLVSTLGGLVMAQAVKRLQQRRLMPQRVVRQQQQQAGKEKDDATPVEEGVMTGRQKKHSRLFKGYAQETPNGKRLRELVAEKGDVSISREVGDQILPSSFSLDRYLRATSCGASAVVLGVVKGKSSQLTDEGTFTFTDYEITVEEVIRDNPAAPIQPDAGITVSRPGGAVRLGGHTVSATDASARPLRVGERYLLFLQFIPETGAYKSLVLGTADGSFQLRGDKVVQVSDQPRPFGPVVAVEATPFINQVRAAAASGCENQGGTE